MRDALLLQVRRFALPGLRLQATQRSRHVLLQMTGRCVFEIL
jgi:hypothetical protein